MLLVALAGTLVSPIEALPQLDVVFAMDVSGSMGKEINAVRSNVNTIFTTLASSNRIASFRAGAVQFGQNAEATDHVTYKQCHCILDCSQSAVC